MDKAPPCFNIHNNLAYCQRSQTLQPIRASAFTDLPSTKLFLLDKYLASQLNPTEQDRASYANVPHEPKENFLAHKQINSSHSHHQHQRLHSRSHSQYHYNMCQVNDPNNYYNLSNTFIPTRAAHPSPLMHEQPAQIYNQMAKLDDLAIMQVCSELGCLDSPPPIPGGRNYTISGSGERGLFKIMLPSSRSQKRNQDLGLPRVDLDTFRKK